MSKPAIGIEENASDGKKANESRKLVKWGSSETLIMSLPRSWVKKFQLNKDSEVSIVENPDGSLLVSPSMFTNEKPRFEATIHFNSDEMDDMDLVELEITTKYLDGNDVIILEKKEGKGLEKFPTKFQLKVQEIVQSLLGLEITSLLSTKIKIQDIMSIQETNIDVLVRIIADNTVDLFQNLHEIFLEGDYSVHMDALLISKRQVRKYFLRILRELRKGLLVPTSLSRMGLTAQDTVDMAFYITDIAAVADNIEYAFNALITKQPDKPDKQVADVIHGFIKSVFETFKKSVDSFLFKAKKDAIQVLKTAPALEEQKRKIENDLDNLSTSGQYVGLEVLLDILSKILDHARSICLSALRRIM
jgi:phosphate uptake regulator